MEVDKAGNGHKFTLRGCFWILSVVISVEVLRVISGKALYHPRLEGDTRFLTLAVHLGSR
jgi:hypothetical protein